MKKTVLRKNLKDEKTVLRKNLKDEKNCPQEKRKICRETCRL
jgi:hypothetical protein